ncbi:hypothetical protein FA09DRAFT_232953 [Tilletiopsis washingtonensis]|uniref:Uncharacterized protein n=1 Tax=Tilletiopsis washingtonensis TaxID=58919 RepID=A0A316ZD82_9BASI|nr:hypothetical protein FA09DRAFT_232953 [Tilletiopsis washingtonensis]PWN99491.1 hypothetical protein FA09DRAFT_232953 [Tilletiopsis washingtonensis]
MRPAGTRGVRVPAGWRCSAVGALAGGATPVCRAFASCCCRGALHLQVQQRSMPPAREMAWALPPPQAPRLAAATAAARLHPRRILSLGGGGGAGNGGVSGRAWRRAASEERVLPLTLPLRSSQPAARRFFSSATSKRLRALFCEVLAALRAHFLISSLAAGTLLPNGRFLAAACGHRRSSSSSDHDAHSTRPSSRLHFVGRPTPQPPRAPRAPLLLEPLLNPPRRARRCPCSTARAVSDRPSCSARATRRCVVQEECRFSVCAWLIAAPPGVRAGQGAGGPGQGRRLLATATAARASSRGDGRGNAEAGAAAGIAGAAARRCGAGPHGQRSSIRAE